MSTPIGNLRANRRGEAMTAPTKRAATAGEPGTRSGHSDSFGEVLITATGIGVDASWGTSTVPSISRCEPEVSRCWWGREDVVDRRSC